VYGRIATVSIKPQMEQEFLKSVANQGIPMLMALDCIRLDVYLDGASGQALVTTLWPTRDAAEAATRTKQWQQLRARLDESLDGEPSVRIMHRALAY
jgi:quinol monooxygenase YgiN